MTLYDKILGETIKKFGKNIALLFNECQYTYEELNVEVIRLARCFDEKGIKKGNKVVVSSNNPMTNALLLLAILYVEAIPMPVFAKTGQKKLMSLLETYEVNYMISNFVVSGLEDRQINIETYPELFFYKLGLTEDFELDNTRLILFSSGTTSTPKAIMLSENNIFSNVKSISAYLKLCNSDSILLVKELSHSSSIIGELFVGLYNGCKIVFSNYLPIASYILEMLSVNKVTVFFAVPTLLKGIIEYGCLKNFDLMALRIINFYGASMNAGDITKLVDLFPDTNIIYSYGQTEASPRVTYIEKKDIMVHSGSCGKPIEDVMVSVINNGVVCDVRQIGEVVVQGPNVMLGYYRDMERTRLAVREGRLFTGDYGYLDEDGFLYITGRKDNMIISAGKNIYPEEIEGVLMSYPNILEALVRPCYKANSTCDLYAYVVVEENVEIDKKDLFLYCKEHLEVYKIPKSVFVVKELEKTMSGKIIRGQRIQILE